MQTSADKGPLGIGITSAIRHSSGNSPQRNNQRKRQLSFGARTISSLPKEDREATRRVHSSIRIKIQQVPLNLTCSKGNATECRPRVTGLRQLNNVLWLFAVKLRTQQLSLRRRIRNKSTTWRTKGRNIRLRTKHMTF